MKIYVHTLFNIYWNLFKNQLVRLNLAIKKQSFCFEDTEGLLDSFSSFYFRDSDRLCFLVGIDKAVEVFAADLVKNHDFIWINMAD